MLERFAAFFLLKYPAPTLHFFPFPLLSSLRFVFSDTTGSLLSFFFSSRVATTNDNVLPPRSPTGSRNHVHADRNTGAILPR